MTIQKIDFVDFEKQVNKTRKSPIDVIGSETGKAYVVAITRGWMSSLRETETKNGKISKRNN